VSERRREGIALLARLGLDPDRLAAGEVPADRVRALLAGEEGPAVAAALAEVPSAALAALLVELEAEPGARPVRKALRRTLYLLAQRGVEVPARPEPAAPVRILGDDIEGLVSHVDGHGDRVVWIVRPLASGGVLLVAAQVNEPEGLRDVWTAELSRKQLRTTRERLVREGGLRLVAADWRVLDALLVEGHERAGAPDRQRDYLRLRPRVTTAPPAAPAEPASTHVQPPADAAEAAALVAGSGALIEEPELASWWPDPAALAPFVDELAAIRDSPLVLNPVQQEERVREVLRRAAGTVFPPSVTARRLAGTAYVLAETGRGDAARRALAVADLLRSRPDDAAGVPFLAALVERVLGRTFAAETARREEEARGSLVVTPGQLLRDRSSGRPGRTRG
jgi:hypothetical protein